MTPAGNPADARSADAGADARSADADRSAFVATARRAASGDAAAVTELVRRTSPMIWRTCAALVDRPAADDLTQDTYVRALRSLHSYRGESDPARWLLTIARRVCADEIATRQRRRATADRLIRERPTTDPDPTGYVDLIDALARLSPQRREAFVLTTVAGLSYAEAAHVCECPIGTIRSRVARARSELLGALRGDLEGAGGDAGVLMSSAS